MSRSNTFQAGGVQNHNFRAGPVGGVVPPTLTAGEYLESIGFDHILEFDVSDGLNGRADKVGSDDIVLIAKGGNTPEIHATPDYVQYDMVHEVNGCGGRLVHPIAGSSGATGGGAVIADTWAVTNYGVTVTPGNVAHYDMTTDACFVWVGQMTNLPAELNIGNPKFLAVLARNEAAAGAEGFAIKRLISDGGVSICSTSTASGDVVIGSVTPMVSGHMMAIIVNWNSGTNTLSTKLRSNVDGWNSTNVVEGSTVVAMNAAGNVFAGLCALGSTGLDDEQGTGCHLWGMRTSEMSEGEVNALWAITNTTRFDVREFGIKAMADPDIAAYWPGLTCNERDGLVHYSCAPEMVSETNYGGTPFGAAPGVTGRLNYPEQGGGAFETLVGSGLPGVYHSSASNTGFNVVAGPALAAFDTTASITVLLVCVSFSKTATLNTVDRAALHNIAVEGAEFVSMLFGPGGSIVPLSEIGIGDAAGAFILSADHDSFDTVFMAASYNPATGNIIARMRSAGAGGGKPFQKATVAKGTADGVSTGVQMAQFVSGASNNAQGATAGIVVLSRDMPDNAAGDADFDDWFEIVSLVVVPGPNDVATATVPKALAGAVSGGSGSLSSLWTTDSGPGVPVFSAASSPTSNVTFPVAGVYVLRLTATDSGTGVVQYKLVTYTVS